MLLVLRGESESPACSKGRLPDERRYSKFVPGESQANIAGIKAIRQCLAMTYSFTWFRLAGC